MSIEVRKPPTPPEFVITSGVVLVVLGVLGGFATSGFLNVLGAALLVVGAAVAGVGVVAAGVRLGTEWADYDRAARER
jgi:hypothetical protein